MITFFIFLGCSVPIFWFGAWFGYKLSMATTKDVISNPTNPKLSETRNSLLRLMGR